MGDPESGDRVWAVALAIVVILVGLFFMWYGGIFIR